MVNAPAIIVAFILAVLAFIGLTFLVSSIWEKERRAAISGGVQFLVMLGLVLSVFCLKWNGFLETQGGLYFLIGVLVLAVLSAFLLMARIGANKEAVQGTRGLMVGDVKRYDEREIVFARNERLKPDSEEYKAFYKEHPEYEENDARRRERGGPLGRIGTVDRPCEEPNVAATIASAFFPVQLATPDRVNPPSLLRLREKDSIGPAEATERVKGYARKLGAGLVGITEINPLWIYSHRGMSSQIAGEDWGKELEVKHKYAVVFATEMSFEMVMAAPHTPTMIETMRNYAKGAGIASQLAAFIANLGYPATANHLRHYDGLLVPLAVDAGLGELSRMGFLITKEFGPRLRLAAVTTDLPLIPDKPVDIGVRDFCKICRKCAVCCPSGSIPPGDAAEVNGTLRWKLNAETCFDYWGRVGTDCAICMRVCPWSHVRTFPHEVVVESASRSMIARRLFAFMDDFFYGKMPKPKDAPGWAQFRPGKRG